MRRHRHRESRSENRTDTLSRVDSWHPYGSLKYDFPGSLPSTLSVIRSKPFHHNHRLPETPSTTMADSIPVDKVCPRFTAGVVRYAPSAQEAEAAAKATKLGYIPRLLGVDELMYPYLWKAVLIECFATTFLTFASIGAVLSSFGRQPDPTTPPIIEPPSIGIAITHFFFLGLFILSFAPASGGHMNPMISFATMLTGHTPIARGVLYILAQTCGSVIGAQIIKDALPETTINWTKNQQGQGALGTCASGDLTGRQQFLLEFGFSMVVLIAAYGIAFDARQAKIFGPVLAPIFIAATIGVCIYSSGTVLPAGHSGAIMNPARCFGPAAVIGGDAWDNQWSYWFGPFVAGVVNALVYILAPPHHKKVYEEEAKIRLLEKHKRKNGIRKSITELKAVSLAGSG
ncbi:hypothetical protein AAMO2058_001525400 [Amorphochlora amoebiformis]